ncbi:DUF1080 domain-containing protein [Phycisphaeraceae bacterium D3-23]
MPTRPLLTALLFTTTAIAGSACHATQDTATTNEGSPDTTPSHMTFQPDADNNTLAVGQTDDDGWICMFNGEDLTGWTPKFSGYELGENFRDTFRVEDGKLIVDYSNWERFDGEFGHLFFTNVDGGDTEFSHYIMRLEYRFVGEQVPGGPGWAWRNNGIMFHGQPADTMGLNQDFPVSVEAQFNGGHAEGNRPNGNVCTPGTHIHKDGELTRAHVINFDGPTHRGDQWITYEIEVHGSQRVIHRLNGEVAAVYGPLLLDENDGDGKAESERRGTTTLGSGTISLQAETAPIEFRNIRIKVLEEDAE